ncbi:hypothetical protein F3Y22_tig00116939pilonHSYRG00288 [Hibiscus syriacus]|uniref:Major facilitator superfamily (MFS) profile domain-containing protein n=1 Tax=Hibiscus syriacus TaxID=106335 RepID=A0A6A2WMK2_HIBSY|nr:hypothetical protein F3Y22_tig00116939pilonHSYRG00288 [Hibiscus syriacus]
MASMKRDAEHYSHQLYASCQVNARLVGVGEASFISLAGPFIDDNAPISQRTAWLATFYMCIPTGIAVGYVYGGLVGEHLNWSYAFWGEALLMLPFAVFGFVVKPLQLKGFSCVESKKESTPVETISAVTDGTNPLTSSLSILLFQHLWFVVPVE